MDQNEHSSTNRTLRRVPTTGRSFVQVLRSQFENNSREEGSENINNNNESNENSEEEDESLPPLNPLLHSTFDNLHLLGSRERETVLHYLSELAYLRYRRLYPDVSEDEDNNNTNSIYINENEIDFRTYPLNINWSAIENDKKDYYNIFDKYGYFGVALYCSLENIKDLKMDLNNFLYSFLEYFSKIYKNNNILLLNEFIQILPSINIVKEIIFSHKYLSKELPVFIIVFKIYEIYFLMYGKPYYQKLFEDAINSMFYLVKKTSDEIWEKSYEQIKDAKKIENILKDMKSKIYKKRSKYIKHLKELKKMVIMISNEVSKENFKL